MRGNRVGGIFGREDQLVALTRLVARVAQGHTGSVVLEGEAGIGKSRIVAEVVDIASAHGFIVHVGAGHELTRDVPFGPLIDALGLDASSTDRARRDVAALLAPPTTTTDRSLLGITVPEARARAVDAIVDLLAKEAAADPVALVVEDVHWTDSSTATALRAIARRTSGAPVLVVATARSASHEHSADTAGALVEAGASLITLPPLDDAAVAALVHDRVGCPAGQRLAALVRGAAGNPLLVILLLEGLQAEGHITRRDGVADVGSDVLPRSLAHQVLRTLSGMEKDARGVLRLAAVLGTSFTALDIADVSRLAVTELAAAIDESLVSGLLRAEGSALVFRHELVREAVYRELPLAMRQAVHRELARSFAANGASAARVAAHFTLGAQEGDPDAVQWIQRAAREAMSTSPLTACDLLERAAAIAVDGTDLHASVLADLVEALGMSGRLESAEAIARDLVHRVHDPHQVASLERVRGLVLLLRNRCTEAADVLELAAGLDHGPPDALAEASLAALGSGDLERACALADAVIANPEVEPSATSLALCVRSRVASLDLRLGEAEELSAAAVTAADRVGQPTAHRHLPLLFHALTLHDLDRLDECERLVTEEQRLAADTGIAFAAPLHHALLAFVHLRRGDVGLARVEAEAGAAACDETGADIASVWCRSLWALSALHQGDVAIAAEVVAAAKRVAEDRTPILGLDLLVLAEARVIEEQQGPRPALDVLTGAFDLLAEVGARPMAGLLAPDVVHLALRCDDKSVVDRSVEVLADAAARTGLPSWIAAHELTAARATQDREGADRAVAAARRSPRRILLGACLEEVGTREALREATAIYADANATHDLARAGAALRAAGGRATRRPAPPRSGEWSRLSAAEARVVDLVADGASNPTIADALFISRRTVETHLHRIYAKLGLASRVELALWAARHRPR